MDKNNNKYYYKLICEIINILDCIIQNLNVIIRLNNKTDKFNNFYIKKNTLYLYKTFLNKAKFLIQKNELVKLNYYKYNKFYCQLKNILEKESDCNTCDTNEIILLNSIVDEINNINKKLKIHKNIIMKKKIKHLYNYNNNNKSNYCINNCFNSSPLNEILIDIQYYIFHFYILFKEFAFESSNGLSITLDIITEYLIEIWQRFSKLVIDFIDLCVIYLDEQLDEINEYVTLHLLE